MKTIRITRQGFPNIGQHSWMNYIKFILSKKYNVIIDPINPDIIIQSDLNYNENQIDELISESILSNTVSDTEIGVALSSGIDSSIIANELLKKNKKLKSFSFGFKETQYNEIDNINDLFSKDDGLIKYYKIFQHKNLLSELKKAIYFFETPLGGVGTLSSFSLFKIARQQKIKVLLSGEGADELFGGYEHYSRMLWVEKWLSKSPQLIRHSLGLFAKNSLQVGVRGRNWLLNLDIDWERNVPSIANYFDPEIREQLIKSRFIEAHFESDWLNQDQTLLQRATRSDFKRYLAEDILVKVDRSSMLNSLELRAPFLG